MVPIRYELAILVIIFTGLSIITVGGLSTIKYGNKEIVAMDIKRLEIYLSSNNLENSKNKLQDVVNSMSNIDLNENTATIRYLELKEVLQKEISNLRSLYLSISMTIDSIQLNSVEEGIDAIKPRLTKEQGAIVSKSLSLMESIKSLLKEFEDYNYIDTLEN